MAVPPAEPAGGGQCHKAPSLEEAADEVSSTKHPLGPAISRSMDISSNKIFDEIGHLGLTEFNTTFLW